MSSNKTLFCYCENHCPDNKPTGTCFTVEDGKCFSQIEEVTSNGAIKITKGCTPPETGSVFQCRARRHHLRKAIQCCDNDMCNDFIPELPPKEQTLSPKFFDSPGNIFYLTAVVCTILVSVAIVVGAIITFYLSWKRKKTSKQTVLSNDNKTAVVMKMNKNDLSTVVISPIANLNNNNKDMPPCMNTSTARPYGTLGASTLEAAMTDSSGSGKGLPFLAQMTISRQFTFVKQIGEGGFGSVWKATWFGDPIAVKIFSTREEESWLREKEMYQTNLLRHDNILGFIAADIGGKTSPQMLLVMEYHEYGSLYDFLQSRCSLDVKLMLRLMHSMLSGVTHLHNEIVGSEGKQEGIRRSQRKPVIAHRDLKSKNILVKNNLTCCIADLGHCARYLSEENRIDLGHQVGLVGTKRYMPPEVITDSVDKTTFEAYKACDMYNVSLILWEIARCSDCLGSYSPYSYPFQDALPNDPSVEEVFQVVCVSKMRPHIPSVWMSDAIFTSVARIIVECWSEDWQGRQSALRVKKTLAALIDQSHQAQLEAEALLKYKMVKQHLTDNKIESAA